MTQRYWRQRASASPAIPVGCNGGAPSDEEVFEWRRVQEQAEKEHERDLQAKATAEELHDLIEAARREVDLAWIHTLKEDAERGGAKNRRLAAAPVGRPPKADVYREMLRDIRVQDPGSDGETEFKRRLTRRPGEQGGSLNKRTAQRRYAQAARALAQENGTERDGN